MNVLEVVGTDEALLWTKGRGPGRFISSEKASRDYRDKSETSTLSVFYSHLRLAKCREKATPRDWYDSIASIYQGITYAWSINSRADYARNKHFALDSIRNMTKCGLGDSQP